MFVYSDTCSLEFCVVVRVDVSECLFCSVCERYVIVYECYEAAAAGSLSVLPKSCISSEFWCLCGAPKFGFLDDGYVNVVCVE